MKEEIYDIGDFDILDCGKNQYVIKYLDSFVFVKIVKKLGVFDFSVLKNDVKNENHRKKINKFIVRDFIPDKSK